VWHLQRQRGWHHVCQVLDATPGHHQWRSLGHHLDSDC
jgi:hypothetical protein